MEINSLSSAPEEKTPRMIRWGVYLLCFLPIIIIPPSFRPSDWDRVILLRIILTAVTFALAWRFFYKKDAAITLPHWKNPAYLSWLAWGAFIVISFISAVFSQDPYFSFFGSPERAGGMLTLISFFCFATLLVIIANHERWEKLLRLNVFVGVLASLLAIIQYFGLLKNIFIGWEEGGPPSFMGSSTAFAMYLVFAFFSAIVLLVKTPDPKRKRWYGALLGLLFLGVAVSGSRATYLGILIGLAYYLFFLPADKLSALTKKIRFAKIAAVAVLICLAVVIAYANFSPKLPAFLESNQQAAYFFHNRLSLKLVSEDLLGTRLAVWKITWQAISEKPWLGWGPENFYIGFEKYFDPTYPPSLQKLWWDRPHNAFLEIWTNSGVFALVAYLAFWVVLMWGLQRLKNKQTDQKEKMVIHGLQAMFFAYLVTLFFNFDSFATWLAGSFFIAYSWHLLSAHHPMLVLQPPKKLSKPAVAILGLLFLAAVVFLWSWNLKPLYGNERLMLADNLSKSNQCASALEIISDTNYQTLGILKPWAILKQADVTKACAPTQPNQEVAYSQKTVALLAEATNIQPKFTRAWLLMAGFTDIIAARQTDQPTATALTSKARTYLQKALALSPKRQEIFVEMAKSYLIAKDYPAMEETSRDCLAIDPSLGECHWYLGVAQVFLGQQAAGKIEISKAKENGYNNPAWLQLAAAYITQKNYREAAQSYEKIDVAPQNLANYHATLAYLYQQAKDYAKAFQHAAMVFYLQPENKESLNFIESLRGLDLQNPGLHTSLAIFYQENGQSPKAAQEFSKVENYYLGLLAQNPHSAQNHFNLAITYNYMKQYQLAYQQAMQAITLDQGFKQKAQELINMLPGN